MSNFIAIETEPPTITYCYVVENVDNSNYNNILKFTHLKAGPALFTLFALHTIYI